MTPGMKWFIAGFTAFFFLMMAIFVMVSSGAPGIPNPAQDRADAYTSCLQRTPTGFGGLSDAEVATCKEVVGEMTP